MKKGMKLSVAARREENWGWIMVAPTIIGLLVLNLWPFVQTLYTSFCEHLGFGHYKFIGLQNYIEMFQNAEFWKATWNTIYFCILTVPLGLFLSLLVAMLLNAKSYYEAASIDGAGKVTQFFHITLPMVSPTLFVVMIMRLMASVKVYDLIYMMVEETNPAVTSVQSLMYLFYRESFIAGSRGSGSAIVIWTVLLIGLVTVIQFMGQKKWVNYDV